tara:strand:+ start:1740 stop:2708 length:969 start_codon:yes stop_codon:yes gene_type:complete
MNLASDNVKAGEDVLIVSSSDQDLRLLDALTSTAAACGAGSVSTIIIACPDSLIDVQHPKPVKSAVANADLTIVATTIRFPRAYDDLSQALYEAGKRQVLINNAPIDDFVRGAALTDPFALRKRTVALAEKISSAKKVRITSKNGTDLCVKVCRPCLPLTGFADEDTGFGSFPSGEAMLVPEEGSAEGIFVADSYGQVVYIDGAGPQIGLITSPIKLEFKAGNLIGLTGGLDADLLQLIIDAGDINVSRLAELGLGTNPDAREIGHVENKFRLGTAHIALGDNHLIGWRGASVYGGTIVSNRHIDLVSNNIKIEVDGNGIIP